MDDVQNDEVENDEVEALIEIPKTVKVGNREVTLVTPKSLSVRYDLIVLHAKNPVRGLAAALGLCWGGMGRPKARYESSYSIGQYGGEVLDELASRGVAVKEILDAGVFAHALIMRSIVPAAEVDKAEGN